MLCAAEVVPERDWINTFEKLGFSDRAATSYANMTRTVCENDFPPASRTLHGKISLEAYIEEQIVKSA